MTSTDSLRAEAAQIAARHPHISGTCPPHAAALHRLAALITENELPGASITVQDGGEIVTVGGSFCELPENVVRRWAQALELVVDARPVDDYQGAAATMYVASGVRDGVVFHVSAIVPVPAMTA